MLRKTINLKPAFCACVVMLLLGCQSTPIDSSTASADEAITASIDALLVAASQADLATAAAFRLRAIDLLIAANDLERAAFQLEALPEARLLSAELRASAQLARATLASENDDFIEAGSLLQELDVSAQETLSRELKIRIALLSGEVYRNLGNPKLAATSLLSSSLGAENASPQQARQLSDSARRIQPARPARCDREVARGVDSTCRGKLSA